MKCEKNIKRFLFLKWQGSHKEKIIKIGMYIIGISNKFSVRYVCSKCGQKREDHFTTEDMLLKAGVKPDEIERARHTTF